MMTQTGFFVCEQPKFECVHPPVCTNSLLSTSAPPDNMMAHEAEQAGVRLPTSNPETMFSHDDVLFYSNVVQAS